MMKNWLKIASVVLISLLFAAPCFAATYYLDADDGNDSNPGTTGSPWQTIDRAAPQADYDPNVVSGDTVILRGGYYGAIDGTGDWDKGNTDWITYIAEDAVNDIPYFQRILLGLPKYTSPARNTNAYLRFDGVKLPWALDGYGEIGDGRGTNVAAVAMVRGNYFEIKNSYIEGNVDFRNGTLQPKANTGVYIWSDAGLYSSGILVDNCIITDFSSCVSLTKVGDPALGVDSGIIIQDCNLTHVYDDFITGNVVNKSRFESNLMHDGQVLGNTRIIDGNVTRTGTFTRGTTMTQESSGSSGILTYLDESTNIFYIKGTINSSWDDTNEVVADSGGTVTPTDILGTSAHTDAIQLYGIGGVDGVQCVDVVIRGNRIWDTQYQGIFLKQMTNVLIENNLIWGSYESGSGPFYLCNDSLSGTIRNNVCSYMIMKGNDLGGEVFDVYNNIVTASMTFGTYAGETLNMHNNIVGVFTSYGAGVFPEDNIEYDEYPMSTETLAALFTDPDTNDFTLLSDSDAVDYGDPENSPTTDILGVSRDASPDAGCYEYVSSESGIATLLIIGGALAATSLLIRGCLVGNLRFLIVR